MDKIKISNKMKLDNEDEYCIIEKSFENEEKKKSNIKLSIKIYAIRNPISTATIFLTRNDEYVGHISANLYDNGTASLIMSGIHCTDLPDELEKYRDVIQKHDTALFVDKKYRRQGKATLLMNLMFQYLEQKGIKDLEVDGITDDVAMKTYLSTGAEKIGDKKAIYKNIKKLLSSEPKETKTNEFER